MTQQQPRRQKPPQRGGAAEPAHTILSLTSAGTTQHDDTQHQDQHELPDKENRMLSEMIQMIQAKDANLSNPEYRSVLLEFGLSFYKSLYKTLNHNNIIKSIVTPLSKVAVDDQDGHRKKHYLDTIVFLINVIQMCTVTVQQRRRQQRKEFLLTLQTISYGPFASKIMLLPKVWETIEPSALVIPLSPGGGEAFVEFSPSLLIMNEVCKYYLDHKIAIVSKTTETICPSVLVFPEFFNEMVQLEGFSYTSKYDFRYAVKEYKMALSNAYLWMIFFSRVLKASKSREKEFLLNHASDVYRYLIMNDVEHFSAVRIFESNYENELKRRIMIINTYVDMIIKRLAFGDDSDLYVLSFKTFLSLPPTQYRRGGGATAGGSGGEPSTKALKRRAKKIQRRDREAMAKEMEAFRVKLMEDNRRKEMKDMAEEQKLTRLVIQAQKREAEQQQARRKAEQQVKQKRQRVTRFWEAFQHRWGTMTLSDDLTTMKNDVSYLHFLLLHLMREVYERLLMDDGNLSQYTSKISYELIMDPVILGEFYLSESSVQEYFQHEKSMGRPTVSHPVDGSGIYKSNESPWTPLNHHAKIIYFGTLRNYVLDLFKHQMEQGTISVENVLEATASWLQTQQDQNTRHKQRGGAADPRGKR